MVAAKVESFRHGDNQHTGGEANRPLLNRAATAKLLNVGETSVKRAAAIRDRGVKELQEAVESGSASLWAASEIARQPQDEQRSIVGCEPASFRSNGMARGVCK
jgi:hypothetical protein